MRILGKILIGILVSVGIMTILVTVGLVYFLFQADGLSQQAEKAPEDMILRLNFDSGLSEADSGPDLASLGLSQGPTLQDAIIALRRARDDDRVKAVVGTVSGQSLGLAQIQDVRDAVAYYRESGKPSYLYSETIGELVNATTAYYLASAFEEIWLQPSGSVGLTGLAIEQPYLKDFLDRFGVRTNALQRYEYKTAAENLTNTEMSEPNREALDALFGSIFNQIVDGVGTSRSLTPDAVRTLMSNGPMLAQEAIDGGLVDQLGYRDQFNDLLDETFAEAEHVSIRRYLNYGLPGETRDVDRTVALINAVGPIQRGESDDGPFSGAPAIGSDTLAGAIRGAAEDEDIDAILVRIDSPGGSYVASDAVWREVVKARETEKPFVVSMGNAAASGGYYIAMAADTIFAQPGTITGSIGVIVNKLVLEDAFEKLDINWTTLSYGDNGDLFTATRDFNEAELERMNRTLDAIYEDFTTKAAQGRDMPLEEMQRIARGRVWSGEDAHRLGLVDELGGLSDAIDHTKIALGLTPDDLVNLAPYPPPQDALEALLEALEEGNLPFGLQRTLELFAGLTEFVNTWIGPALQEPAANLLYAEPLVIR